jgi:tRNA (mo5U34)-methyltransferase
MSAQAELLAQVGERQWYHTVELAPGLKTPGYYDHSSLLKRMPIPMSLAGQRCLDIGTFDGFWAFELERRGAAEVVAIDILDPELWDWPARSAQETIDAIGARKDAGEGFEIAARALGSNVQRHPISVYDLDPEIHGQFDFIFMGSLLLHLRDPIGALERVRAVCAGEYLTMDAIDPWLSVLHPWRPIGYLEATSRPWWWMPNLQAYKRMVHSAGFDVLQGPKPILIPPGAELRRKAVPVRHLRHYEGRLNLIRNFLGDPQAYILAKPA